MEDNQDTWDDYVEGTVFTINTNESTTTKYSPFFLMFGRNRRLPFEVEKLEQPLTGFENLVQLVDDLSSGEAIREHVNEMSRIRDTLFPRVDANIKQAQERQKHQYKMKRGQSVCPFLVGDLVLQRNMLQMTKAGYKYEDQWLGPYKITQINPDKETCRLENGSGKKLTKQVSIKHLKPYRSPSNNGSNGYHSPSSLNSTKQSSMPNTQTPPVPKPRTKTRIRTPPVPKPRTKPPLKHANTVSPGKESFNDNIPPSTTSTSTATQQPNQKPRDPQPTTSVTSSGSSPRSKKREVKIATISIAFDCYLTLVLFTMQTIFFASDYVLFQTFFHLFVFPF